MFLELAIVVALIIVNGLLAMSELAVVSSRTSRLKTLADQGSRGAAMALRLAEDPGRFLSTVQIGITLVGVLSGAFSGATLGLRLTESLRSFGLSEGIADALGVGAVVLAITYLSLIIGELVPKQIALRDPEAVAARVAPAMSVLSRVSAPMVWVLNASGKLVLRLIGHKAGGDDRVTEEEVKTIINEAESAGVIEAEERDMIAGVMRLADRTARAIMTPRREVEVLDLGDDPKRQQDQVLKTRRTRLPVRDGSEDSIVGAIFVKDVVAELASTRAIDLRGFVQHAPVVLDQARALDVLKAIRASTVHMALVFDEYGHFEGVITSGDFLAAITGAFQDEGDNEPALVQRSDGSWLVSGWMAIDEFADALGVRIAHGGDYETIAGFVLHSLNRLPEAGESFEAAGWRFEVVDLDGRRIDKLLVSRIG